MRDLRNSFFFLLGVMLSVCLLTVAYAQQDYPGAATPAAADKQPPAPKLAPADERFIRHAAGHNEAEIELGKLAIARGSTDAVKQYGERMVREHGLVSEELHMLAQRKGVELPTAPDRRHRAVVRDLERREGLQFDRLFARQVRKDHDDDAKAFDRVARSSTDPEVRAFAQKGASLIRQHAELASALQADVRGASASTGPGLRRASKRSTEHFNH